MADPMNDLTAAWPDAELYLRLTGERMLLGLGGSDRAVAESPVTEAASALVAVRAISAGAAQAVVDDYSLALGLRSPGQLALQRMVQRHAGVPRVPQMGLGLRVISSGRVIEQPWGRLQIRYVKLADNQTTIHVALRTHEFPSERSLRLEAGPVRAAGDASGLPRELIVTDDRGAKAVGGFSGGGSGPEWHGQFRVSPPLAPDTKWIDVLGERIILGDGQPAAGAHVEATSDGNRARSYLWHRVAGLADFPEASVIVDVAIQALSAAGTLPAADPVVAEIRKVMTALHPHRRAAPGSGRGLPEPWRSVLAGTERAAGPAGEVEVASVTPEFDGVTAIVTRLVSDSRGFCIDVEVAPSIGASLPFRERVDQPVLSWWAADDRGNRYLGRLGSWRASDERDEGQVEFWPPLDPQAAVLNLMPTGMRSRAIIRIPLTWSDETVPR